MVVDDSWKPYVPPEEGAPEEEEVKDDDSGVDVEDVACSICGVFESTEDNDIIMCDRTNCFRAFHVNCTDPPMTEEEPAVTRRGHSFCGPKTSSDVTPWM